MLISLYISLLIMSFVAGTTYLVLKMLRIFTRRYLSASWHYYVGLAAYSLFILPLHQWVSRFHFSPALNHIKMSVSSQTLPLGEVALKLPFYLNHLAYILLAGTFIFIGVIIYQGYKLYRRIDHVCKLDDSDQTLKIINGLRKELKIKRKIPVYISSEMVTPFLFGIFKPRIVLPNIPFSTNELRYIFLHELIHYKRRDVWLKFLLLLINAIHWFNPLVYLFRRDIDRYCELDCDNSVVRSMNESERKRYCQLILNVLWHAADRNVKFYAGFSSEFTHLQRRINIILRSKAPLNKQRHAVIGAAMTLTVIVASGIVSYFVGHNEVRIGKEKSIVIVQDGQGHTMTRYDQFGDYLDEIVIEGTGLLAKDPKTGEIIWPIADGVDEGQAAN